MGTILFALVLDPAIQTIRSPLNLWFLDEGTLAGPIETVTADLHRLFPALRELGWATGTARLHRLGGSFAVYTINRRPNGDRPARLASAVDTYATNQCPNLNPELRLTQRNLHEAASTLRLNDLLARANQVDRARLLAASAP